MVGKQTSEMRMEVAYIAPSLDDTTGWGRWCVDFLRHVRGRGIRPIVWAPSSTRDADCGNLNGSAVFHVLPELFDHLQSRRGLLTMPAIARFMREPIGGGLEIKLVHSLEAYPWGIYGHHLARSLGVPHVMTTHGRYGYIAADRFLDRLIFRHLTRRCRGLVAVSEAVCSAIRDRMGKLPSSMSLVAIQNAVDSSSFTVSSAVGELRGGSSPLILSVTRFVAVKDLETAVLAFGKVRQKNSDARYIIVGPGNGPNNRYYQKIVQLIADQGISGIDIVGRVTRAELAQFYERATLLLHTAQTLPDDFEASGLILLEAGLFGLPVVASQSGGIPEVVTQDVTGLLTPEKDIDAVAGAMTRIIGDPGLARRLGEGNRQRALGRNWDGYVSRILELYSLAGLKGVTAAASQ